MKNTILIGFSANPELVAYVKKAKIEKGILNSLNAIPGGTTFNVSQVLTNLGIKDVKMLLLTGGQDFNTYSLDYVLKNSTICYQKFDVLDSSNIALITDNSLERELFGFKGSVDASLIEITCKKIEEESGKWRVCTGLREEEVLFAKALFKNNNGFRFLNPRLSLIEKREVFISILKEVDLLIMNKEEFWACEVGEISQLHDFGPHIVIVTDGAEGGRFSLKGNKVEYFNPVKYFSEKIFTTGAGDSFHGSLIGSFVKENVCIYDIELSLLKEFINFSAKYAGKKITMEGSSNVPFKKDL